MATVEIHGIRHHGPGSARSVRAALEAFAPDCVLIEGPPEGTGLIEIVTDPELVPPVAILAYDPGDPTRSGFYPFAAFSPEWQAMRHAVEHGVEVRFIDLPLANALLVDRTAELLELLEPAAPEDIDAIEAVGTVDAAETADGDSDEPVAEPEPATPDVRLDPLGYIGRVGGEDGERWWERLVEERRDPSDMFAAIAELMAELREAVEARPSDLRREAAMRRDIRAAVSAGFTRIAVVCGAWHAPALVDLDTKSDDDATLRGLPRTKVETTWVPWSDAHLATASGYGAGVESPGWYRHLWTTSEHVTEAWMTKVGRVLREEGIDVSSAHLIEAARLADTLAALRGRAVPGLTEMTEASRSAITFGSDVPLRLIGSKLIIGTELGSVPERVETAPLARDLAAHQRRLRLPPETGERTLELDLRGDTDRARSHLLHRLRLLDVPWGEPATDTRRALGTFREVWKLRWDPAYAIALVTQSRWGNTILDAAEARVRDEAASLDSVPALAGRLEIALFADLPHATRALVDRLATAAAVATDVTALLDALPALARSLRYGNVRGTDRAALAAVTDGIVVRASIGLSIAVASLDDEAATEMVGRIENGESAVTVLERPELREAWYTALRGVADQRGVHGLVVGRTVRILLDRGVLGAGDVALRLSAAISRGATPPEAAAFMEGFLAGPGALLVHDRRLFELIDGWVCEQPDAAFDVVLPLLRRTFARFSAPERRTLGDRVRATQPPGTTGSAVAPPAPVPESGNTERPPAESTTVPAAEPPDAGFGLLDDLLGLGPKDDA